MGFDSQMNLPVCILMSDLVVWETGAKRLSCCTVICMSLPNQSQRKNINISIRLTTLIHNSCSLFQTLFDVSNIC